MSEAGPDKSTLSEARLRLLNKYRRGEFSKTVGQTLEITRRPADKPAPLSPAQEQVWRRAQVTGDRPPFYNESIAILRQGPLDAAILERSLTEIIRRHEVWRTTYDVVEGQPAQIIHPAPDTFPVSVVNLQSLPMNERAAAALQLATAEARQPFDLSAGPLIRATLATLADDEHRLFLTMHQSVIDGISVNILFPSELTALYGAFVNGRSSPLPELPIQYADYAYWQHQWMKGEGLAAQLAYWREKLADLPPVPDWPGDHATPATLTYRGAIEPFTIPRHVAQGLKELSRQEGVTLFMTLLVGFSALLWSDVGQEDLIVGTLSPVGRKRSEVQSLIGYFLNPVALRMNLAGNPSVRELLHRSQEVVSGAMANDDVPLEYLLKELGIECDAKRLPLFPWIISLAPRIADLAPGWNQSFMDAESGGSRWELYLELREGQDSLLGRAQYNPDVFEPATLTRILGDWDRLLEAMVVNPDLRLSELPSAISAGNGANLQRTVAANETEPDPAVR